MAMYGMIQRALLEMLDAELGADANPLRAQQDRHPELFLSASLHDDTVTLAMIGAAAAALGSPVEAFLVRFGEAWIAFADRGAYGPLMRGAGEDLEAFIGNLDRLHVGVRDALPGARTPGFRLVEAAAGRLVVGYRSSRPGLEPFVQGLLQGLLDRFGLRGTVARTGSLRNDEILYRIHLEASA